VCPHLRLFVQIVDVCPHHRLFVQLIDVCPHLRLFVQLIDVCPHLRLFVQLIYVCPHLRLFVQFTYVCSHLWLFVQLIDVWPHLRLFVQLIDVCPHLKLFVQLIDVCPHLRLFVQLIDVCPYHRLFIQLIDVCPHQCSTTLLQHSTLVLDVWSYNAYQDLDFQLDNVIKYFIATVRDFGTSMKYVKVSILYIILYVGYVVEQNSSTIFHTSRRHTLRNYQLYRTVHSENWDTQKMKKSWSFPTKIYSNKVNMIAFEGLVVGIEMYLFCLNNRQHK